MDARSSLTLVRARRLSGEYRLPVPENRSLSHLLVHGFSAPRSRGAATGSHTSRSRWTPIYGVFRYRPRQWPEAPLFSLLPLHAMKALQSILLTANGLLSNPTAVESV